MYRKAKAKAWTAVGLVLNWNGPKTGVTEYRRKWRDWEKAFELAWAKRSRRWNGEGAFISRARSFQRRRGRPIL